MNYLEIKKGKICRNCNEEFLGTEKQTLCDKCREKVKVENRLNSFKIIKQDVHCKYCGKYINSLEKKQTRKIKNKIFTKVCEECKLKNRIKKSEMMKKNNPMKNQKTINKTLISKYGSIKKKTDPLYKQLGYESFNDFMKSENNPMKNKINVAKVKDTFKRRINNGEITYKKGINHHNFRGFRNINKTIRDELGKWRKQILNECEYKCIECGVNNNKLHIHHTEPLYLIILNFCEKYNLDIKKLKDGTDDFYLIKEKVLEYHYNNNIGIVLCENCHDLLDIHYHKKRKNEN